MTMQRESQVPLPKSWPVQGCITVQAHRQSSWLGVGEGPIAHLVERRLGMAEAPSSNLGRSTQGSQGEVQPEVRKEGGAKVNDLDSIPELGLVTTPASRLCSSAAERLPDT